MGHMVMQLVEALRYWPEGHRFDFQWCHRNVSLTLSWQLLMALGLTQSLTELGTRIIFWEAKLASVQG